MRSTGYAVFLIHHLLCLFWPSDWVDDAVAGTGFVEDGLQIGNGCGGKLGKVDDATFIEQVLHFGADALNFG